MSTTTIDFDDLVREQRFDELVRTKRAKAVRIIAAEFGNLELAEEAVQEALTKMWADRVHLDRVDNLEPWLLKTARFKAMAAFKSNSRSTPGLLGEHVERLEQREVGEPSSLPCLADEGVMERIQTALAAMSPRCRQVVQMVCIDGLSRHEAAEKLGIAKSSLDYAFYAAFREFDLNGPAWINPSAKAAMETPEAILFRSCPDLLKLLSDRQREAVRLCYIERMPAPEAAKAMGLTRSAVTALVIRARRVLNEVRAQLASTLPSPA